MSTGSRPQRSALGQTERHINQFTAGLNSKIPVLSSRQADSISRRVDKYVERYIGKGKENRPQNRSSSSKTSLREQVQEWAERQYAPENLQLQEFCQELKRALKESQAETAKATKALDIAEETIAAIRMKLAQQTREKEDLAAHLKRVVSSQAKERKSHLVQITRLGKLMDEKHEEEQRIQDKLRAQIKGLQEQLRNQIDPNSIHASIGTSTSHLRDTTVFERFKDDQRSSQAKRERHLHLEVESLQRELEQHRAQSQQLLEENLQLQVQVEELKSGDRALAKETPLAVPQHSNPALSLAFDIHQKLYSQQMELYQHQLTHHTHEHCHHHHENINASSLHQPTFDDHGSLETAAACPTRGSIGRSPCTESPPSNKTLRPRSRSTPPADGGGESNLRSFGTDKESAASAGKEEAGPPVAIMTSEQAVEGAVGAEAGGGGVARGHHSRTRSSDAVLTGRSRTVQEEAAAEASLPAIPLPGDLEKDRRRMESLLNPEQKGATDGMPGEVEVEEKVEELKEEKHQSEEADGSLEVRVLRRLYEQQQQAHLKQISRHVRYQRKLERELRGALKNLAAGRRQPASSEDKRSKPTNERPLLEELSTIQEVPPSAELKEACTSGEHPQQQRQQRSSSLDQQTQQPEGPSPPSTEGFLSPHDLNAPELLLSPIPTTGPLMTLASPIGIPSMLDFSADHEEARSMLISSAHHHRTRRSPPSGLPSSTHTSVSEETTRFLVYSPSDSESSDHDDSQRRYRPYKGEETALSRLR